MAQAQDPTNTSDGADEIVIDPDEIVVEEAPTGASATATATLTDEKAESPLAGERVVYVTAPMPPKPRSNRVVGALLALAGALLFGVVYAVAAAGIIAISRQFGSLGFTAFIRDASFWVPVLFFTIGFVLVVLLLNRAAWWLHVLGSLLVAAIVYFGSIGVLLLLNGFGGDQATFGAFATSPIVIAATLVAREVSIWVGFLIAWRGGRVKLRNKTEREAFDAENPPAKTDGAPAAAA